MANFNLFDAQLLSAQLEKKTISISAYVNALPSSYLLTEDAREEVQKTLLQYIKLHQYFQRTISIIGYLDAKHFIQLDHPDSSMDNGDYFKTVSGDKMIEYLTTRADMQALYHSSIQVLATYIQPQTTPYAKSVYKLYLKAYRKAARTHPDRNFKPMIKYLTKATKDN